MGIYLKVIIAATIAALVYQFTPASVRAGMPVDAVHVLESFLEVMGGIYSVLAAFVIYVVWEQFNSLQKLTIHEGSLAAEVPRLASHLGGESTEVRRRIASAIRAYLEAATAEWEDLAQLKESHAAIKALDAVETRVGEAGGLGEPSQVIYGRLVDAVAALRECRMSRVSAAKHRMPTTLSHLLGLLSLLLLAAFLAIPPGEQPAIGLAAFVCLAAVFSMIRGVVWDMDHPFVGAWNVSKAPFEESGKV
jgi:Protein of unknown function (DUF4239)